MLAMRSCNSNRWAPQQALAPLLAHVHWLHSSRACYTLARLLRALSLCTAGTECSLLCTQDRIS